MRTKIGVLLLLIGYGLLYPGLTQPLLDITGFVDKAELAEIGREIIKDNPDTPQMVISIVDMVVGNMQINGSIEAYQKTRSILGTVFDLRQSGYPVVAFLIMLFSVVIPVFKGVLLLLSVFFRPGKAKERLQWFSLLISKWSMADVFVVGVFVSFLAANAIQKESGLLSFEAVLGNGFFFFLGYCLLSILASQLLSQKLPLSSAR